MNPRERRAYELARMHVDGHRPRVAIDILKVELAKRPDYVPLLLLMARAVSETEDDEEPENRTGAITIAERAVTLDPNYDYAWRVLSRLYLRAELNEKVRESARTAVRLAPDEWLNHVNLVRMDISSGYLDDDTRASGRASLALRPENADSHIAAGQIARVSYRMREAQSHFRRALAIEPDNYDARYFLAVTQAQWSAGRAVAAFVNSLADNVNPERALGHLQMTAALALLNLHGGLAIFLAAICGTVLSLGLPWKPQVALPWWVETVVVFMAVAGALAYLLWIRHRAGVYFTRLVRSVPLRTRYFGIGVGIVAGSVLALVVAACVPLLASWAIYLADGAVTITSFGVIFAKRRLRRRRTNRMIQRESRAGRLRVKRAARARAG